MRVSTSRQADEGESIPAQRDALRKYVADHGMTLAGEYVDGGASGTKADRDELKRLMQDVEADRIDTILFVKLDRWFRSVRHYTNTQEVLDAHGVTWTAIWEPIYDTSTPQGRLIVNQMMSIAQFEAENTSLRIRQVFAYKAEQGEVTSGKIPFGFSIIDKRLMPNDDADIIRRVFEFYNANGSLHKTRDFAASIGYDRDLKPLKQALQNRKYIGEYHGIKDWCPAIIDRELFEDVQRKLSMNIKESAKTVYVFAGMVRCAECGRRMSGRKAKRKNGVRQYYRCPGDYKRYRKDCHNNKCVWEDKIEALLLEYIDKYAKEFTATVSGEIETDNSKKIEELRRKTSRLTDLYVNELITIDEYTKRKDAFTREIEALETPVKRSESPLNGVLHIDLNKVYPTMSNAEKRAFWRELVDRVEVSADGNLRPVFLD